MSDRSRWVVQVASWLPAGATAGPNFAAPPLVDPEMRFSMCRDSRDIVWAAFLRDPLPDGILHSLIWWPLLLVTDRRALPFPKVTYSSKDTRRARLNLKVGARNTAALQIFSKHK